MMLFERGSMVQFVLECMLRLEPGRMLRYEPNRILIFEQGSLVRLEKCLIVALVIHRMLRFQQCLIFLFNPARLVHSSQFVWYDSNQLSCCCSNLVQFNRLRTVQSKPCRMVGFESWLERYLPYPSIEG